MDSILSNNYTSLAPLYDKLMEDVDYEAWAGFIDEIIQIHHSNPVEILELACGTGSLSLSLSELECYNITASDRSFEMVEQAKIKAKIQQADIEFLVADFLDLEIDKRFDVVFSVFDSVNYLHQPSDIHHMLLNCMGVLNPGGLLIFDFSTPKNSLESVDFLNNDENQAGNLRFFRTSRYDAINRLHYNEFEIEELDPVSKKVIHCFREIHKQRIYSLPEILSIVEQTPYHLIAKYDDFTFADAHEKSARVTMVLQCPI